MAEPAAPGVVIDREVCLGTGLCIVYAPRTFAHDDETTAVLQEPPHDDPADVRTAVEACPVGALSLHRPPTVTGTEPAPWSWRIWGVSFALLSALLGAWVVATPLFGQPDEPAHYLKASSLVRGQLLGDVDPQPHDGGIVLGAFDDLTGERSAAPNEQHRLDPAAATQRQQRNKIRRGGRRDADHPGTGKIVRRTTVIPQQSVRPAHVGRDVPYQSAAVGTKHEVEVTGEELSVSGRRHGGRTRIVVDVQFDVVVASPQLEARSRLARLHGVTTRQVERDRGAQPCHRTSSF